MNLHHLRVFYEVARHGNFTRAAAALRISQPAVSEQVRALEADLGLDLVLTAGRETRLTPAGEELATYAARLFALEREAEEAMEALRGLRRGTLRLAAGTTPGVYLLPGLLGAFRERYPDVAVSLEIRNSAGVAQLVAAGDADLGVTGGAPEPHPELVARVLRPDPFVAVAAPGHPLARQGAVTAADLAAAGLVIREPGSGTRRVLDAWLAAAGVRPARVLELNNTEAVKRAAMAGLGAAVLPRLTVRDELLRAELVALPLSGEPVGRDLYAVTRRQRRQHPVVQAFLDLLLTPEGAPGP